jgi:uncharacterized protein YggE
MSVDDRKRATITVTGEGRVCNTPDMMVLVLGIQSFGKSITQVLGDNNLRTRQVGEVLRNLGVSSAQMQVTGLNIIPIYKTIAQAGDIAGVAASAAAQVWQSTGTEEPISIIGHNAVSWMKVSLRETGHLGELLNSVIAAGVNLVHSISLTFSDETPIRHAALEAAGRDAHAKGESLAKGMGKKLGALVSASEEFTTSPALGSLAPVANPSPPGLAPGELPILARVRVVYELT